MQALVIVLIGFALVMFILKWDKISRAIGLKKGQLGGRLPQPKYKKCFFCGTTYVVRRSGNSKCPKCHPHTTEKI